ncbi:MAG TPA: ABC transporter permease [Ilumatobacter sp.]|nr:ABC transporter permease [Ilumatobacter sp.]
MDRSTWLVVERELREALRRKSIWAMVGLILIGATAVVVLPEVLPDDDDPGQVALVGEDLIGVTEALAAVPEPGIVVTPMPDRDAAALAIEDGDADLAVLLRDEEVPELIVEDESSDLVAVVREVVTSRVAATRLAAEGVDLAEVTAAFVDAAPEVSLLDADQSDRQGAAFVLTMILYLVTVILTSQVAAAVATEKSNRVSEVLLAIVPPRSMLAGKVIGVGCIGLVILMAGALPVAIRFALGGDLPQGIGRTIVVSAVWFLGGLVLYLTLAGSLGAMVARQEEAGAVVMPLTMLLIAGYFVAITAGDSVVGLVLGVFPLTSPMVAPFRVAIGAGTPIEYAISIAVLLLTVVLVGRLATVVFRRAIVRTGERLKLRDVL